MKTFSLIPQAVLRQYAIGNIGSIKPVVVGLIHQTYEIKTNQGQYIMQRLHPVLSSQEIAQDFLAVTAYLQASGFPSPRCILTKKRTVLAPHGGFVWRMQTKLPGKTIETISSPSLARQAGEMYARFHRVMDGFDQEFQSDKLLHETEKIYEKFISVVKQFRTDPLMVVVREEVDLITKQLPKHFLPVGLPLRVIHGDPKISNILFVKDRASAIIDLDTCNRRPILVELGDAFRSWCGKAEDHPNNTFSLPMFKAAWSGYKKGADGFLTRREVALVPKAIGTITLELAARFLTDYFEDTYFGWDSKRYPSRRAHNLARCRGQLKEFVDYRKKVKQINVLVK